jgi:hypothetical protein
VDLALAKQRNNRLKAEVSKVRPGIIFELEWFGNQLLERNSTEWGADSKKLIFLNVW